jgi:hypothetical protein
MAPVVSKRDILSEFTNAMGLSCRTKGIKLNERFNQEIEEFYEARTDEPKTFHELVERGIERRVNLLRFEDDVIIYLILTGADFIAGNNTAILIHYAQPEIKAVESLADARKSRLERMMIYQSNADFRLLTMSSGIIKETEEKKEETAKLYYITSDIRKRRDGSFSTYGMLMDKLGVRFERYYDIMEGAFERSKFKPGMELSPSISKDERLNILMDKLAEEKDLSKRDLIKKELSLIVNMN